MYWVHADALAEECGTQKLTEPAHVHVEGGVIGEM